MIVTCVHVKVKPGYEEAFRNASLENHRQSIREPGNLRFDICRSSEDPGAFLLYEAYTSEEQAAAHKQTEHYRKWRETVEEMMAEPRRGVRYDILAPEE